jgi:hypothetical protein
MWYWLKNLILFKWKLDWKLTKMCLFLIRKLNRCKDDRLADTIHELARRYQTRPQDGWIAPFDWDCWKQEGDM